MDGLDWEAMERHALEMDARRRGILILDKLYSMSPQEFSDWLDEQPEEDHMALVLQMITVAEFLLESAASNLGTTGETMIKALKDLSENW